MSFIHTHTLSHTSEVSLFQHGHLFKHIINQNQNMIQKTGRAINT